VSWGNS